eukprot:m.875778 g.875778  ORF g.875778 m.875778 type:complete len:745 (-) comp23578_c0_seq40:130-2364(-)
MNFASPFAYYGPGYEQDAYSHEDYRVDTNVVAVSMSALPVEAATRQSAPCLTRPLACRACDAVFNPNTSHLAFTRGQGATWQCEFCNFVTEVSAVMEAEITRMQPGAEPLDFILGTPVQNAGATPEPRTLFCVDTSGSMSVTEECPATCPPGCAGCTACADGHRNEHVSRLDVLSQAICSRLDDLCQRNSNARVGLVTFHDSVDVYGDATHRTLTIDDDRLHLFEELLTLGESKAFLFDTPLRDSVSGLRGLCSKLGANGQTALGPALLVSLAAAGTAPGSHVLVCTDGLSNVGVGALSPDPSDFEREYCTAFYTRATAYAVSKNVCVSVISIEGEDCNLAELGHLAEATGGSVHRVTPSSLAETMEEILAHPIHATNVDVRLVPHTSLQPYYNARPDPNLHAINTQVQTLASVTSTTEATFQFGPASEERKRSLPVLPTAPHRVPIQIQVEYTTLSPPQRLLRVFTSELLVTDVLAQAQQNMDLELVIMHAARTSAQLGLEGDFDGSVAVSQCYKQWIDAYRRTAHAGQAATEDLYADYDSALELLGKREEPGLTASGRNTSGERALVNPLYGTVGPPPRRRPPSMRNSDDTADALYRLKQMRRPLSQVRAPDRRGRPHDYRSSDPSQNQAELLYDNPTDDSPRAARGVSLVRYDVGDKPRGIHPPPPRPNQGNAWIPEAGDDDGDYEEVATLSMRPSDAPVQRLGGDLSRFRSPTHDAMYIRRSRISPRNSREKLYDVPFDE